MLNETLINTALDYTRTAVTNKIEELITKKRNVKGAYKELYDLMKDYPFRKGKALRPALCISIARAVGGMGQWALLTGAALEMYHNAFLIHDDVEDESESRRGKETLHQKIGIPRAINTGDATNVLALSFLLENLDTVGVTKALHVMHEIENMARQSVEGQSMELDWIANQKFDLGDNHYFRMCVKKTCWYTFITPCRLGYITGIPAWKENDALSHLSQLTEFGMNLGIAFQIQDDLLNLVGNEKKYGKEICGDLYEGKRTIMLNHVLAHAGKTKSAIREIIQKPRNKKTRKEVEFVLKEMERCGSILYGKNLAKKFCGKAIKQLDAMEFLAVETPIAKEENWHCEVVDRRFIKELVNYVIERNI
jgi:geranylgeranyl diphosphate synthase type II